MKLCGSCGAEDATMECDVCHAAYYCNEECRLAVFDLHVEYDCTGGSCTATPREAQAKEDGAPPGA